MPAPLSEELRIRVVQARENGEGSIAEIASRFKIGTATVKRWTALHRVNGSVTAKPLRGFRGRHAVDAAGLSFLRATLTALPDSTLVELCAAYLEEFDIKLLPQTMSRVVRRMGFTRKRGPSAQEPHNGPTLSRPVSPSQKSNRRSTLPGLYSSTKPA